MQKSAMREMYEDMMYHGKTKEWDYYLEKEKQQIATAWHDGNMLGRNGWIIEEYDTGKQYYEKNFNNNENRTNQR